MSPKLSASAPDSRLIQEEALASEQKPGTWIYVLELAGVTGPLAVPQQTLHRSQQQQAEVGLKLFLLLTSLTFFSLVPCQVVISILQSLWLS